MLKAGSLAYALFLALITALISGFIINLAYLNRQYFLSVDLDQRYEDVLWSGISRGLSLEPGNFQKEYFNIPLKIKHKIRSRPWGCFEVCSSSVQLEDSLREKTALFSWSSDIFDLALYVSNKNSPLSLSGDSEIIGDVQVAENGIIPSFIEGQSFSGDQLVNGKIGLSQERVPALNFNFRDYWNYYLKGALIPSWDSAFQLGNFIGQHPQPFYEKTLVYHDRNVIELEDITLKGNIIIISNENIKISSGCQLNNIVLIAPKIEVHQNNKLACHLIAHDSIILHESAYLNYPSSAIVLGSKNTPPYMLIEKNCSFDGNIILMKEFDKNKSSSPNLAISPGARVTGGIYCQGLLENQGYIRGTCITEGIILKTRSAVYHNQILDGKFNRKTYLQTLGFIEFKSIYCESQKIISHWISS